MGGGVAACMAQEMIVPPHIMGLAKGGALVGSSFRLIRVHGCAIGLSKLLPDGSHRRAPCQARRAAGSKSEYRGGPAAVETSGGAES